MARSEQTVDQAVRALEGLRWLNSDNREQRLRRVVAYGDDALAPLIRFLIRHAADELDGATEALVAIGAPAIGVVAPLLRHRKASVRKAAVDVLAGIGTADAIELIRRAIERDSDRRSGASLLSWRRLSIPVGIVVVSSPIAAMALNAPPYVRLAATLLSYASGIATTWLLARNASYRHRALSALAGRADPRTTAVIARFLADPSPETQRSAGTAIAPCLRDLAPADAVHFDALALGGLVTALRSCDRPLVLAVLQALAAVGDERSVRAVEKLANTSSPRAVREAAQAALPGVLRSAEARRQADTLLRPASAPEGDTLVRPVGHVPTDEAMLVRPAAHGGTEGGL